MTTFERHLARIEHIDFQSQFIAISGMSVLDLILSTHAYIQKLLDDVKLDKIESKELYERIVYLLCQVENETETQHDASIVVYLYCLADQEPQLAYKASILVLETSGLFWARQFARGVVNSIREQQPSIT